VGPLTALELAGILGAKLRGNPSALGRRVLTDSRSGVRTGDIFFGLPGPHFDGSAFAHQALADGASLAVVAANTSDPQTSTPQTSTPQTSTPQTSTPQTSTPQTSTPSTGIGPGPDQAILEVPDVLASLQKLAAHVRRQFRGHVVAVTGSNGKTLVKDLLTAALSPGFRVSASPRSYNSQVGVALSLLQADAEAEFVVVECGISRPGEMNRLEAMVRPDYGIFVNVGDAHLEGLGRREITAREKAKLFRRLGEAGWVVTAREEALALEALGKLGLKTYTVGSQDADFVLKTGSGSGPKQGPHLQGPGLDLKLKWQHSAPLLAHDAALAAAAASLLGASAKAIAQGLAGWQPAAMRLEISTTPRGLVLINDAYTADPQSMERALEALHREPSRGATVAVLAGMAQLGEGSRRAHRALGSRVAELGIQRLVGVGPGGRQIAQAALAAGMDPSQVHVVASAAEASMILEETCKAGDRVLLKGSRPEGLEAVAASLLDALSPTHLFIDLDAIVANFRAVRRAAGPGRGVMAVVKSFGYGIDALRIAGTLQRAGVDYLAVAYPDEGVQLRQGGIHVPILVQNLLRMEAEKIVRHGLTAQISDAGQIPWLEAEAQAQQRAVRAHLKVDTGMGRAGATRDQALPLARRIEASDWLILEGLMTHFAAADDPAFDAVTHQQISRFEEVSKSLADAGLEIRWLHAANSAAVARFPEACGTMVRAGLGLFGFADYGPTSRLPQRPSLRLVTRVISVRRLPEGEAAGYGLTFRAEEGDRHLALVAIGYNDGYPWALSNRGWMLVHGHACPVAGRVSMDVTALDVTSLGDRVEPGDEVVVFGPDPGEPDLLALARLAETIPYELLTRLSPRIRRIFLSGQ
jgi:alanine racemase